MKIKFDDQLDNLKKEMVNMSNLIEKAIQDTVSALIKQDEERAKEIMLRDDEIDAQEKEIENLCMKLLLVQQPVAGDLRTISAALKMITDMERIGDHASDISELTIVMAKTPYVKRLQYIEQMAKGTLVMLIQSLDAYIGQDLAKAKEVIRQDDHIDALFVDAKRELIELIHENADNGEQAADLLMVAKYFERIGDHATNIAEWVIYSITGEHKSLN